MLLVIGRCEWALDGAYLSQAFALANGTKKSSLHSEAEVSTQGKVVILKGHAVKSAAWAAAMTKLGHNAVVAENVVDLLGRLIVGGNHGISRGDAVVFRSMNDRPTFAYSFALTALVFGCVALAKIRGVAVWWVCHNVNRESYVKFTWITLLRRGFVAWAADRIFVTDPLLTRCLTRVWPEYGSKVRVTSFGVPVAVPEAVAGNRELIRLLSGHEAKLYSGCSDHLRKWVGLCAGHPGEKYLHFKYATRLVDAAAAQGIELILVIVGDLSRGPNALFDEELRAMVENPRILLIDKYLPLDERYLNRRVHFLWRGYADWSTPYSLYSAAAARLPVLALRKGVVSRMVEQYQLGATVNSSMKDVQQAFDRLERWNPSNADRYLEERTWQNGAKAFLQELDSDYN